MPTIGYSMWPGRAHRDEDEDIEMGMSGHSTTPAVTRSARRSAAASCGDLTYRVASTTCGALGSCCTAKGWIYGFCIIAGVGLTAEIVHEILKASGVHIPTAKRAVQDDSSTPLLRDWKMSFAPQEHSAETIIITRSGATEEQQTATHWSVTITEDPDEQSEAMPAERLPSGLGDEVSEVHEGAQGDKDTSSMAGKQTGFVVAAETPSTGSEEKQPIFIKFVPTPITVDEGRYSDS